jgi:hypothetical protein
MTLKGAYTTIEEAIKDAEKLIKDDYYDWYHVVDIEKTEIVFEKC